MRLIHYIILGLLISCDSEPVKYSFVEDFSSNEMGWVKEKTDFHSFDIRDGVYYMKSIDTTYSQSSSGPLDISFLRDLPEKYLIETEIKYISGSENLECGLILYGASIYYKFSMSPEGNYLISEFDYNYDMRNTIDSVHSENGPFQNLSTTSKLRILVSGQKIDFAVNKQFVGTVYSKTEIWHDIRFFTTPPMAIEVLYLRIIEISDEEYQEIYGDTAVDEGLST